MNQAPNAPWLKYYGEVSHTLDYPDVSMSAMVERAGSSLPIIRLFTLWAAKRRFTSSASRSTAVQGAARNRHQRKRPDHDLYAKLPSGRRYVYAVNMVGAVANMIHPLSGEGEIIFI